MHFLGAQMALLKVPRFNNHFRVTLSWHSYLLSKSQQLSLSQKQKYRLELQEWNLLSRKLSKWPSLRCLNWTFSHVLWLVKPDGPLQLPIILEFSGSHISWSDLEDLVTIFGIVTKGLSGDENVSHAFHLNSYKKRAKQRIFQKNV